MHLYRFGEAPSRSRFGRERGSGMAHRCAVSSGPACLDIELWALEPGAVTISEPSMTRKGAAPMSSRPISIRAAGIAGLLLACSSILAACSNEPPAPAPVEFKAVAAAAAAPLISQPQASAAHPVPTVAPRRHAPGQIAREDRAPRRGSMKHGRARKREVAQVHLSPPKHPEWLPIPAPVSSETTADRANAIMPYSPEVIPLDDPLPTPRAPAAPTTPWVSPPPVDAPR